MDHREMLQLFLLLGQAAIIISQTTVAENSQTTVAENFQTTVAEQNSTCTDLKGTLCWFYHDNQCVGRYESWARIQCPYRCGYCEDLPPCVDLLNNCEDYEDDLCTNPTLAAFARQNCRKYCNICTYPGKILINTTVSSITQILTTQVQGCIDDPRVDCWAISDDKCIGKYAPWARKHCPYRCGYCPEKPPCVNIESNCDEYGDDLCSNDFYGEFARKNCRKYCNICYRTDQTTSSTFLSGVSTEGIQSTTDQTTGETYYTASSIYNINSRTDQTEGTDQTTSSTFLSGVSTEGIQSTTDQTTEETYYTASSIYNINSRTDQTEEMTSQSTQITDTESQTISSETSTDGILSTADWILNTTADFISASNQPSTFGCNTNFEISIPQCCGPICACNHTVEGNVTDASNNAIPLANVSVFVSGCYCHPFAISNENGYYEMNGICQDNSTLRFETEGYESQLEIPMAMGDGQYQASAQMQLSASVVTKANTDSGGTDGIENPENIFG